MNIVFLTYYSGISNRGVETYVHSLSNELVKKGHHIDVYQGGDVIKNALYTVKKLKSPNSLPKLNKDTVDILIPTNGRSQAIKASVWTKIHNKKLVISGQSGLGFDDKLNLYTFPNLFIALTTHQANWAKKVNPLINIKTIPNGVNIEDFSENTKEVDFKLKHPTILTVGALTRMKRLHLIIESIAHIPDVTLLVVGEGPEEGELKKLAKELIPNRFLFTSAPHYAMPSIYACSDVFAFTTQRYESFGISMLEAMALNRPVVFTPDPIRQEIVGKGGIMAKTDNPIDIAKAIKEALNTKWATIPRKRAEEFSWSKIADRYIQELENL